MKPSVILCDIEGTTSSLSFVHDVLFPLSYEQMESFIKKHWKSGVISGEINSFLTQNQETGAEDFIHTLRSWILEDRKDPVLKSIQGKIWKEAFESGSIQGHVYPDVPPNFRKWNDEQIRVCIFSSGSVQAQKLLFQYSEAGDLTSLISAYFDTTIGTKKNKAAYASISEQLAVTPAKILFLSDVEDELNAARDAELKTIQVLREGVISNSSGHVMVNTFDDLRSFVSSR